MEARSLQFWAGFHSINTPAGRGLIGCLSEQVSGLLVVGLAGFAMPRGLGDAHTL